MPHFKYNENKRIYQINKLVFQGENSLKSSAYIQNIIIPSQSLLDTKNPNRNSQYSRLIGQANFVNYPQICLDNMLGMCSKGQPEVKVPKRMQSIVDYATKQNQNIYSIQARVLQALCKYGLAAIKVNIQNDMSIMQIPRFQVIEGIKILDFQTIKENGLDKLKFLLIDDTKRVFVPQTKIYNIKRRYKVYGLDQRGQYYQALIQNSRWNAFNLNRPEQSDYIELVYPEFYGRLNFVPVVCLNPYHVQMNYRENYNYTSAIQTLINLSLNIFQQDSNLKSSLHMQANPTLFIHGSNSKPSEFLLGPYACNILKDASSKAEYCSPNYGGITLQENVLNSMKAQAQTMIYSILNAAGNSSGDALSIRLQAATLNLISMVKNIGDGITNALELLANIMQQNPDECEYIPYTGFGSIQTGNTIKEQVMSQQNIEQNKEQIKESIKTNKQE